LHTEDDRLSSKSRLDARRASLSRIAIAAILSFAVCTSSALPTFAHSRHHHRHRERHFAYFVPNGPPLDRSQETLMSRGAGFDTPAASPITGVVATVLNDNAAIYAGREQYGVLLSRVAKGTTIVVTGQTDTYYAVAMNNHTTGFIAKTDAQLDDIQITAAGTGADASDTGSSVSTQNIPALAQGLLQSASTYLGVAPYVWGGTSIDGIDCSGFVQAVYAQNGITLPRTAAEQASVGYDVPLRDLTQWQPGDRMYFMCHHEYIDHTGMYIGNGYFIHSSIHHHGVDIDKVESPFYWDHLVAVRRSAELVQQVSQPQVGSADFETNQE
jgi:cell wall-associated NlpC family hydrolase